MCGINGIITTGKISGYLHKVADMNHALAHRGPDGEGLWNDEQVALGHRRLAIIDLSTEGNQPMLSADGNLVLVFNGEIYNYRELRNELKDYPYRTKTDSEVILAAYQQWGIDCMEHFKGMFAFAIWDRNNKQLTLARDRFGVKPLYFHHEQEHVIFSSELRAILSTNLVARKLSQDSVIDYLRFQTVHAPNTILKNIYMLMPGEWMRIEFKENTTIEKKFAITKGRYWNLHHPPTRLSPEGKNKKDIHRDIHELLSKAVERRLVADVPFGAFLSGGIDSSTMVGLMSQCMNQPVSTFSVVFDEKEYCESTYSQLVAKQFDTRHHEIHLKPVDFLNMIPDALHSMDHPSGDGPNTWVVSKVTREAGVSMAISGLGGDEVFGGYNIFKRLYYLQQFNWLSKMPELSKKCLIKILESRTSNVQIQKTIEILQLTQWNLAQTYPLMRRLFSDASIEQLITARDHPTDQVQEIVKDYMGNQNNHHAHTLSNISKAELSTYLVNTLLRDTDQMSMAHALEVRVPFLDHELVEYVLNVNDRIKYPHTPKQLLVDSLNGLLPEKIVNRKKMGFSFPWNQWMRNELKPFCETNIDVLERYHLFNSMNIKLLWQRFQAGDPSITWSRLWPIVVLANWMEENGIEE